MRSRDSSAVKRKRMWILSTYLEYNRIGCRVSVAESRYCKKLLGICGGPAISLARCNPRMRMSRTSP